MRFPFVRTTLLLSTFFLGATIALPALADDGSSKIGYIDVRRVLHESKTGQSQLQSLQSLLDARVAEIEGEDRELGEMRAKLQEELASLEPEARIDRARELEDRARALRRRQQEVQREFESGQVKVLVDLEKGLAPLIARMAQDLGFTMIFKRHESGVVYVAPEADLTLELVRRYDAQ